MSRGTYTTGIDETAKNLLITSEGSPTPEAQPKVADKDTNTDYGMSTAQYGMGKDILGGVSDITQGIISGVSNKKARREARSLADQVRSDQLRSRDEWNALQKKDLQQRDDTQDITHRRQNASMRFQRFQQSLEKRATRQQTMNSSIGKLGGMMQKNEGLKDMILSNFNRGRENV